MNLSLTPELERRIAQRVESGLYTTASEVVREALRLFFERDEVRARQLEALHADLQAGLDQAERGELRDGAGSRARVEAVLATRRARPAAEGE
jgi:antitoxin ParD1/3/4